MYHILIYSRAKPCNSLVLRDMHTMNHPPVSLLMFTTVSIIGGPSWRILQAVLGGYINHHIPSFKHNCTIIQPLFNHHSTIRWCIYIYIHIYMYIMCIYIYTNIDKTIIIIVVMFTIITIIIIIYIYICKCKLIRI